MPVKPNDKRRWKKQIEIWVRRDYDGKVLSMIVDVNHPDRSKFWSGLYAGAVVIDRQNGRQYDMDTIINRAQSISEISGFPYDEELTWPCKAEAGFKDCSCPKCAEKINSRSQKSKQGI